MPSSNYVKTVAIPQLDHMIEPPSNSCFLLSSVLSLLRHPKELRSLDNTLLLSHCIRVLRSYTDEDDPRANKLFGFEFGFLCYRVITLLMHVGILRHTNTFGAFVRKTSNMTNPHDVSVALSESVMDLMRQSYGKPKPRDWLLGILTSTSGGRMFLRTVGGFFNNDVGFFLKIIWQDRKGFSEICSQVSPPGWGLPLLLIGEHLRWAAEDGFEHQEEWGLLQTLCFRYAFVARGFELGPLSGSCFNARYYGYQPDPDEDPDNEYYETSLVDTQDARIVLQGFVTRMANLAQTPMPDELILMLFEFIKQDVILDITDLMPALIKVLCSRVWAGIDVTSNSSKHPSGNTTLNYYARRTFDTIARIYSNYAGAPPKTISTFVKALAESDFINLFGRLVLLPWSIGSNISTVADENPETFDQVAVPNRPDTVPRTWSELTGKALFVATSYGMSGKPSNGILGPFYSDWLKIRRCFSADFPQHYSSNNSFQEHKNACFFAFFALGSSFGYVERKERTTIECAYPRCPGVALESDTQLACEHCLATPYCSRLCQAKHWNTTTGEPHRDLCPAMQKPLSEGAH